jgi:diacylglycerol O-acyltransferase / wax synthase
MAGTPLLDRLTASDLFLLLWDDYGWSSDIGGLAICDGTSLLDPKGRVRIEAVRGQLEPRLHLVPRFRQLLYRPRLGLGWPLWELWLLPGLQGRRVGALLRLAAPPRRRGPRPAPRPA